jgi:hypothetical protein
MRSLVRYSNSGNSQCLQDLEIQTELITIPAGRKSYSKYVSTPALFSLAASSSRASIAGGARSLAVPPNAVITQGAFATADDKNYSGSHVEDSAEGQPMSSNHQADDEDAGAWGG